MSDFTPPAGYREVKVHPSDLEAGDVFDRITSSSYGTDIEEVAVWRAPEPLALPTTVGTVIAIGGWRFVLIDLHTGSPDTWFLLAAGTDRAYESMRRANVRAGAGYSREYVLSEAEQEQRADRPGYVVLSTPLESAEGQVWRRDIARQVIDEVEHEWRNSDRSAVEDFAHVRGHWGVA